MKKTFLLYVVMIALAMMGCNHNPKPVTDPKPAKPAEAVNYDLAIMDQGQLVLFDVANKTALPIEEEDSLFNLTFTPNNRIYYSVKHGDNTLLKFVDFNDPDLKSQLAVDWEVPYELCVGTAYYCLEAPVLAYYPKANILGMHYMQSPNYGYSEFRIYDFADGKSYSAEDWEGDLSGVLYDIDANDPYEDMFACAEDNGDLYYRQGDDMIFLADKLSFDFDEELLEEGPAYMVLSVDPTKRFVLFHTFTYLGDDDEMHGPQCLASLDGKMQKILGEYDESYPGQWLSDGSLVYAINGGIHVLTPDGKDETLYPGTSFVVRSAK